MNAISFSEIDPDIKLIFKVSLDERDNTDDTKRFMTHRLILFTEGDCDFRFSDKTLRPSTGAVLFIPAMEPYTTCFHGRQELLHICFYFKPETKSRGSYSGPYDAQRQTATPPSDLPVLADNPLFSSPFFTMGIPEVEEKALVFTREFLHHPFGFEVRLKSLLMELLVSLCRDQSARSSDSPAAAEILSYIRNHCGEKLDRERLGAVFHYHPAHLNRLVRRYTGMTTHRYILYVRVRRAEYLLSATDMPVTEIAHQLMFYDSSHFAAVFQRETGMPPGEYRRMARFV